MLAQGALLTGCFIIVVSYLWYIIREDNKRFAEFQRKQLEEAHKRDNKWVWD